MYCIQDISLILVHACADIWSIKICSQIFLLDISLIFYVYVTHWLCGHLGVLTPTCFSGFKHIYVLTISYSWTSTCTRILSMLHNIVSWKLIYEKDQQNRIQGTTWKEQMPWLLKLISYMVITFKGSSLLCGYLPLLRCVFRNGICPFQVVHLIHFFVFF